MLSELIATEISSKLTDDIVQVKCSLDKKELNNNQERFKKLYNKSNFVFNETVEINELFQILLASFYVYPETFFKNGEEKEDPIDIHELKSLDEEGRNLLFQDYEDTLFSLIIDGKLVQRDKDFKYIQKFLFNWCISVKEEEELMEWDKLMAEVERAPIDSNMILDEIKNKLFENCVKIIPCNNLLQSIILNLYYDYPSSKIFNDFNIIDPDLCIQFFTDRADSPISATFAGLAAPPFAVEKAKFSFLLYIIRTFFDEFAIFGSTWIGRDFFLISDNNPEGYKMYPLDGLLESFEADKYLGSDSGDAMLKAARAAAEEVKAEGTKKMVAAGEAAAARVAQAEARQAAPVTARNAGMGAVVYVAADQAMKEAMEEEQKPEIIFYKENKTYNEKICIRNSSIYLMFFDKRFFDAAQFSLVLPLAPPPPCPPPPTPPPSLMPPMKSWDSSVRTPSFDSDTLYPSEDEDISWEEEEKEKINQIKEQGRGARGDGLPKSPERERDDTFGGQGRKFGGPCKSSSILKKTIKKKKLFKKTKKKKNIKFKKKTKYYKKPKKNKKTRKKYRKKN